MKRLFAPLCCLVAAVALVSCAGPALSFTWRAGGEQASLTADLGSCSFTARVTETATGAEKALVTSE